MTLVIIIGLAIALFLLAFLTKRRFGVLGLGLAAGLVLAQLWSVDAALFLQSQNITLTPLTYGTAAQVALILLPALLLLCAGPKYHDKKGAMIGSLGFALLAVLFVIEPLSRDFAVAGDSSPVLDFITRWQSALVAIGVALAVVDTLLAHGPKVGRKKHDKH